MTYICVIPEHSIKYAKHGKKSDFGGDFYDLENRISMPNYMLLHMPINTHIPNYKDLKENTFGVVVCEINLTINMKSSKTNISLIFVWGNYNTNVDLKTEQNLNNIAQTELLHWLEYKTIYIYIYIYFFFFGFNH